MNSFDPIKVTFGGYTLRFDWSAHYVQVSITPTSGPTHYMRLPHEMFEELSKVVPRSIIKASDVVDWAVSRWQAEVSNRPLRNQNRRPLDDTWRQIIRQYGGDDIARCGPTHDDLLKDTP